MLRRLIPPPTDAALALALLAWMLVAGGISAAAALMTLPLAWRRRGPTAVAVAIGVGILESAVDPIAQAASLPAFAVGLFAAYAVATYARWPWVGLLALLVPLSFVVTGRFDLPVPAWILPFALLGSAWLAGLAVRRRSQVAEAWRERAEHAEREQAAVRAQALAEERARIARELHDVVTHRVSLMVIQAAAARTVYPDQPATAAQQLMALESGGRQALTELRGMLDLLATTADDRAPLGPVAGLAQAGELVDQVRTAGLPVRLVVAGVPSAVPAHVNLAGYRILQEALTNSLRHSDRAGTTVTIQYGPSDVDIDVVDQGPTARAPGPAGRGLLGMRERVALLGGTVVTGPRPGLGFGLHARLPYPDEPQ
jgi:signal transduction histidine kinase